MHDILAEIGAATTHSVWGPVGAWTVLALPLWALLERTARLHPLAEYRLSQALLGALPVGIVAGSVVEMHPALGPSAALPAAGRVVLPSIEAMAAATSMGGASWHAGHAVGLLTVIAGAIGLVGLGRLLLDALAVARVRAAVKEQAAPALQSQVTGLRETLGIRRPVQAVVTPEASVPVTLGGRRPLILLPDGLTGTPKALDMTLLHEGIHVRRWDDLAHVAERVVAALFAAHPLVGRLRRGIAEARERACDAAVLDRISASTTEYARLLAAFAGASPRAGRLGSLSLAESSSLLKARLVAMRSSASTVLSSRRALGLTLAAVGLVLLFGMVACSDGVAPPSSDPVDRNREVPLDQSPELVGGIEALQSDVVYPEGARENGIEGRVVVEFVVDEDGQVNAPEILRGRHDALNQAALDAVTAQEFRPGRRGGAPVSMDMAIPVTFRLDSEPAEGADGA